MSDKRTAIWWIRRDLRLTDNQALHAALAHADNVLPVFVLDPRLVGSEFSGEKRTAFLYGGLRALDADLRGRGSRLILRTGKPEDVLPDLVQQTGASVIFAEEDYSPFARRRDDAVRRFLPLLQLTGGVSALPVGLVRKADGDPYVVYSPFKRQWLDQRLPVKADVLAAPEMIPTDTEIASAEIPDAPSIHEDVPFAPGEVEAQERLRRFAVGKDAPIYGYAARRDLPAEDGTSSLSPYLRFGMISARRAVVAARYAVDHAAGAEQRKGAETWLSELIWRDFYISVLHYFPHVRGGSFRPEYDSIAWRNDEDEFAAWCEGRTGYPFVDAAMRQLRRSGWMHNRARMVVASFLVKDLLIDWRWGERWFMQHLVDGDPAANNGGWQWAAGTGTDAAPYFRIFNPVTQSEKFDADGAYIRRWVLELADVPEKYIHAPWTMPAADQKRAKCHIGEDYPAPIVDHKAARQRTLDAYKVIGDG
ncbi:MAG: deoxyribodipyrimidine photo-lyase [Caldilineaceae bacterium]|nr:deoxyribodipyrimidine photo-lyase [Caldilineaceae bacterium]